VFWLEQRDDHSLEAQIDKHLKFLKFALLVLKIYKGCKHVHKVGHHLGSSLNGLLNLGANYELANHLGCPEVKVISCSHGIDASEVADGLHEVNL